MVFDNRDGVNEWDFDLAVYRAGDESYGRNVESTPGHWLAQASLG